MTGLWRFIVMSALGAGFYWLAALMLLPTSGTLNTVGFGIGAVAAAVPVLALFDRQAGALSGLLTLILVSYATALVVMITFWGTDPFLAVRGWPVIAMALSCALAFGPPEARPHTAWLTGLMLWTVIALMAGVFHPPALALMIKGPVHMSIGIVAMAALMMVLIAAADGAVHGVSERFANTLSGLLPVLGFTGTVLGIMRALRDMPALFDGDTADPAQLAQVLSGLALAFETTLLGLVGAVVVTVVTLALNPFGGAHG